MLSRAPAGSLRVIRPRPPAELLDIAGAAFAPAAELSTWAFETFIDEGASLENEEHAHLRFADIGFLWTSIGNHRHGRAIVGQCELGSPRAMGRWAKGRLEHQLWEWFGSVPDFVITLFAPYAVTVGDAEFCALVEHELLHAGQERDEFGAPKFRKDGRPAFAMRGHDVEEFVSIVRRYGVGAAAGDTLALVEAARRGPTIAAASVSQACGTCASLRTA